MSQHFVHLRVHSEYSMVDGIARVKPLVQRTKEYGMPAVAITDHVNLFGMVKFFKASLAAGIKPIIGADVYVQRDEGTVGRLLLLCQNRTGYLNLTELISRAYLENQINDRPIIDYSWLASKTEGLIALSAAQHGDVGQALVNDKLELATQYIKDWQGLFPDRYYLELQRVGHPQEAPYLKAVIPLAEKLHIPVVATNAVCFIPPEDFEAHEARVCINRGYTLADPDRPQDYTEQQYLRSPLEMAELFADIPEALQNTLEIAKRCSLELKLGKAYLPNFPIPEGSTIEQFFAEESKKGLEKRLVRLFADDVSSKRPPYDERLEIELGVINKMGFPGYFLIVADFIGWAKANGIPVGPGRGSGAGSLVAYALGITDLDPIEFELLFERFLNPERVSMPDFDIDFCMDGRDRVIEYVAEKYGRESVSQIITYGSMAAKAVVRDVGRVLGHSYGFVDKIAKLIPFEIGMTLKKALQQDETLLNRYYDEEEVKFLIDLAMKLEGITRNAGKHAGGVVIAPSKLTDFAPLYCEADGSNLVTQFDKDDIEAVGLVKFDFLGLRTLTIIDWAIQIIKEVRGTEVDITTIKLDDSKVFDLLKDCNTTAVFQLESRGMKDLIKRLQPDSFEEIIALVALFRPGPLQSGMVDDFIDRKHGRARVEYPHPALEPILSTTYGVILYQEQVMQIAQELAGYTLGAADILRRAMGKKKPEEMAKQRAIFVDGAVERNVDAKVANHIFDLMEKFAGYGFNKSHSAAYALISYQTAYLKTHYPTEFMAAVLSSDMDNTDKVVNFIEDCKHNKIKIVPPQINASVYRFTKAEEHKLLFGLGAIKGAGEAALETIISNRKQLGPFSDLFDFCKRVDTRKVNRRVIEALIKSGAFDEFGVHRASLTASIDRAMQAADQFNRDQQVGQADLFGGDEEQQKVEYANVPEWSAQERLDGEKETLGIFTSGHPIDQYRAELHHFISSTIAELRPQTDKKIITAGLIVGMRTMMTKRGQKMAIVSLDDCTAKIDVTMFSEVYEEARELLIKNQILVVKGEVSRDDYTGGNRIVADEAYDLDGARRHFARGLMLNLLDEENVKLKVGQLQQLLKPHRGGLCPVCIRYQKDDAKTQLVLGEQWKVVPKASMIESLKSLLGDDCVSLEF